MTAGLRVLDISDGDAWKACLSRVGWHDVYALHEYHELAEKSGEGSARLFVFDEGEYTIALPLLLRPCAGVVGLEGTSAVDATSVYGYAGPLSSHSDPPPTIIAGFQSGLRRALGDLQVVALFSRLHPLLPQARLVAGMGETVPSGTTVSIDLTPEPQDQVAQYRQNHRENIARLRRLGASCGHSEGAGAIDEFAEIYSATMRRVGAEAYYLFDREYFFRLFDLLGPHVHLFTCRIADETICAGVFFSCEGIVQYHLGGTREDWLRRAPMKLLIDHVRRWASGRGMSVFHLGGGVGAREDSLFHFKAGFSDSRHPFTIWRWILDDGRYRRLVDCRRAWNADHGLHVRSSEYFPLYRAPTEPVESQPDAVKSGSI